MSHTIPEVIAEANALFTALTVGVDVDIDLPELVFDTDFDMPDETGPAYAEVPKLTVEELTTKTVDGSGVFDAMMTALNVHMAEQHTKGRITGGDYAKVYLGGINGAMQQSVQFLLGKDRAYLENLQLQAAIQLTQAQKVRAMADIQIARAQIQQMAYTTAEMQLKARTSLNTYALSKMALVTGYNGILTSEAQTQLVGEQVDTQRAQTKETLLDGSVVAGILQHEKALKQSQSALVNEQYESQRGQTRNYLSNGDPVLGSIGAQTKLYQQQIVSYKRDAESKGVKMVLDTWTARKTIDEGVAVPNIIDTDVIETTVAHYFNNLDLALPDLTLTMPPLAPPTTPQSTNPDAPGYEEPEPTPLNSNENPPLQAP